MEKLDFTVKQIAREALPRLIDNLVFPNLIYKETIPGNAAKKGDVVSVRCPVRLEANDFDSNEGIFAQSLDNNTIEVKLDHIATVDLQLGAIEAACDFESVTRQFIEPAAAALAEKINAEGLALYRDIPYTAGQTGVTPDGLDDLAEASYVLDEHRVPFGDRRAVWSPLATSKLKQVPAIVNAEKCGSTNALRNGSIGRVFGIDNYMSQAVAEHSPTYVGSLTLADEANEADSVVLTASAGGTLQRGDLLKIEGHTYVVRKDTAVLSSKMTVELYPSLTAPKSAQVEVVPAHTANLVFHPNAFAFVSRPLQTPAGVESYVTSYNGISLRVVRGYDIRYKRELLSMDVLYTFKTLYPELAIRYLG